MTLHTHTFGQDRTRTGERRTRLVILITALMMVVEIVAGLVYGSMALLADGLHMGSHAVALAIAAFAYWYARRHASDPRYSFGTGKVNALGGFAGAMLLAVFALMMAGESVERFLNPVPIAFNQAIGVAILGLVVNAVCALVLGGHGHGHDHGHDHGHAHGHHDHGEHHHEDHNLRSAYLHVLADALTSLLAIVALLAGKLAGWDWMDPAMGVVGAVLVARWSVGLLRSSSETLLDVQADAKRVARLRETLADADARLLDTHLWSIGPGLYAAALVVEADGPAERLHAALPQDIGLVHATIEVRGPEAAAAAAA